MIRSRKLQPDSYYCVEIQVGHILHGNITLDDFTYSVVPIPAAVCLFGSGLPGLSGVARRRPNA